MMANEDQLEEQLLQLGRWELELEQKIVALRKMARGMVDAGRLDESDAVWAMYEEARRELNPLQAEIAKVERDLYGLRRRRLK